jgi:hypothetical protein
MEFKPYLQQFPPYLKILAFFIIVIATLFLTSLLGLLVGMAIFGSDVAQNMPKLSDLTDPSLVAQLKYFQIVSQLGLFIFPCILFIFMVTREKATYAGIKKRIHFAPALVAAAIMLVAMPFIGWLVEVNMQMKLPASWSGIEQWMKQSEDSASQITAAFLSTGNVGGFILNLLMIAIIPAIGEELMFRGILQRLFHEWTKNIHVSIWITAALFSFVHFQFYGFLPRFLMGALFGYMFYWSGSLWLPVLAHFVNNVTAVIVAFLSATGAGDFDFNTFGTSSSPWVIILSAFAVASLVIFLWLKRQKRKVLLPEPAASDSEMTRKSDQSLNNL